ncbi:MAG: hypothetical protein H7Y04_10570 [Verrucomicrobia bacterium]|nr:hypothetical protein [Cytophagales bacterium]
MRLLILLTFLMMLQLPILGQTVNYTIPEGFEKDISKDDYIKIVDIALLTVAKRYTIEFIKEGTIQLSEGQDMQAFNLDNLILKCVAVKEKSKWEKIIQDHFNSMFSSIDEEKKIDLTNYETVKKYLSIRIYPQETVNQRGGTTSLVTKIHLEGTYSLLMLDLPGAFTPVQKQTFNLWKRDISEVFETALTNVNKQPIEKVTKKFEIDGISIEIIFLGNEDYAASYALDLANNSPELVGEWGSVISIPNKGLVNICKVSKTKPVDFVKFIQITKPIIEKSYREHPQPISDQYYWYYKGKFVRIMVLEETKGNIQVISPFGLTELMTEKK